jgi:hypothetical protein
MICANTALGLNNGEVSQNFLGIANREVVPNYPGVVGFLIDASFKIRFVFSVPKN